MSAAVRITPEDARPVRHAVLRPGQPADRLVYPGDDAPSTVHAGVRDAEGALVAVVSVYAEPVPGTTDHAWRIRGMATLPEHRGAGHGRRLLEHALAIACGSRPGSAWCNARTSAAGYYEKLGFVPRGDAFDIPDIGAHVVMMRAPYAPAC